MIKTSFAITLTFLISYSAIAQTNGQNPGTAEEVIAQLSKTQAITETVISPDGTRVAWVTLPSGTAPRIQVASIDSPANAKNLVGAGAASRKGSEIYEEHGIAWSPDSRSVAFLSDRSKPGQLQLYIVSAAGGIAKRLTSLTGFLDGVSWSPNGSTIAMLFTENAPRASGPVQPATIQTGVIDTQIYEQRVALVDVATGAVRHLSPPDLYVYEYDWSPDGKTLAAIAAHGSGDNNWYVAELFTIDVGSGRTNSLLKPGMQIASPRWSPDGKSISFIGGLMSDEGVVGGDIFLVPAAGGPSRNLTPGLKASAASLVWPRDRILFTENIDGESGVVALDPASGELKQLWRGPENVSATQGNFGLSFSADGNRSALIRSSDQHPPEVWAGTTGSWRRITSINQNVKPLWGESRSIHWANDGFNIQGWLIYPRNFDSSRRYPMIVVVHGGPSSAVRPSWPGTFFNTTVFSADNYFVLMPNPRGSYGQGEAFTRANVKDFGYGDLRDILAGVDEVTKTLPVDKERVGVTGWSYGGFMTMWAVTQTNRFRAAVAGAGIANWQSYYGQNGIDQWMIPFFGASVYDDPAVYARSSPMNFIKTVKTPTLILVGDRDIECPTPQSYEFWHALKTLGVPTQLVVYENEGHHIARREHRLDIMTRSLNWFNQHFK
ncbi:MAG TPA: S9 family peptidase [Blastocatellia bacterium]|nr:S9 family peptidase [Blastocatellia bacterium]